MHALVLSTSTQKPPKYGKENDIFANRNSMILVLNMLMNGTYLFPILLCHCPLRADNRGQKRSHSEDHYGHDFRQGCFCSIS